MTKITEQKIYYSSLEMLPSEVGGGSFDLPQLPYSAVIRM